MFVIWGTRHTEDILGYTENKYHCAHCNNDAYQKIFRRDKRFALFWVPLFSLDTTYYGCCPICSYGQKIDQQQAIALARRPADQPV